MGIGTIIFAGLVVVALLVFFIIKRKKRAPRLEGTAVPIHDPEEIKQFKKELKKEKKEKKVKVSALAFGKMTNSQIMQSLQAEAGIAPSPPEPVAKEQEFTTLKAHIPPVKEMPPEEASAPAAAATMAQEQIDRLEAEREQLKGALEREIKSKPPMPEAAPAPTVARGEESSSEGNLKQMLEQEQERFEELEKKFSSFKMEYEHQKSLAWTKEEVLQGQILQLKDDNEKLQQLSGKLDSAEAELNGLRFYKKETEDTLRVIEKEVIEAKRANQELLPQLKEAQEKALKAVQELQLEKVNHEQQVNTLSNKIMGLQKDLETPPAPPPVDEATKDMLESLRAKNEDLIKVNQQLSHELDRAQDFNVQIREKEKILQYELTKARAQSVGLEKICEDFKIHIERLSKVGP